MFQGHVNQLKHTEDIPQLTLSAQQADFLQSHSSRHLYYNYNRIHHNRHNAPRDPTLFDLLDISTVPSPCRIPIVTDAISARRSLRRVASLGPPSRRRPTQLTPVVQAMLLPQAISPLQSHFLPRNLVPSGWYTIRADRRCAMRNSAVFAERERNRQSAEHGDCGTPIHKHRRYRDARGC